MKKKIKYLLICMLSVLAVFFASHAVSAASGVNIKSIIVSSEAKAELNLDIKLDTVNRIAVYRSTKPASKGGKYTLVDTVKYYGRVWYSSERNGMCVNGINNKVIFYNDSMSMMGSPVIVDQSKLKLNQTYYYYLEYFSGPNGTETTSVKSVKFKLTKPTFKKCYSVGSTSAKLSWQQVPYANGYAIYKYQNKKWVHVKTITKPTTTSTVVKNLKAGAVNYLKIQAYAKINGKKYYSGFHKSVKIRLKAPSVKGKYYVGSVYGPALTSSHLMEVKRVVQNFKDNYITSKMSDYDKVYTAYTYLRSNCSYAWRGWQYNYANTAWGALVYGEAQCSGYARAMVALCDAIGVDCRYVHANSKAFNPNHQWNQVKVDGKWYILDAQGGAFLIGSTAWRNAGLDWDTAGLPPCSKKSHPKAF